MADLAKKINNDKLAKINETTVTLLNIISLSKYEPLSGVLVLPVFTLDYSRLAKANSDHATLSYPVNTY